MNDKQLSEKRLSKVIGVQNVIRLTAFLTLCLRAFLINKFTNTMLD